MGVMGGTPDVLTRARIEGALRDAVASAALTVVQAPLGAGKSTAIAAAFADRADVAWIDARPWHRGDAVSAIVHAARTIREDFGRMTLGAIASGAQPDRLARTFSDELRHVEAPLLVVIDNAHEFHDDALFAEFVEVATGLLPANARLLVSGRRLPPMMLGQGLAHRRAAVIDEAIFTFSDAEIAELAQRLGRALDDEAMREIATATQGWAAGVMLALTTPAAMLATDGGPRSAAAAFLAEQLLPTLTPEAVAFLETASVFETIDLRVVPAAREHIAALRRSGALVTEIGSDRFRLHPVLRELAASGLRARDATSAAHRAAASAHAGAGELSAALFHAHAAGGADMAATFLRIHAEAAIATGDHMRVRALNAAIDAGGEHGDVRAYVDGLLGKARGLPAARADFDRAAAAADRSGDAQIAFRARAAAVQYDLGRLAPIDAGVLDDLHRRALQLGAEPVGTAAMLRGWSHAVSHAFPQALETVDALIGAGDAAARFNTGILHAYALTALGEVDAAEENLDALVRLLEDDDRVVLQTITLVWFARLALIGGHTTVAGDAAAQAQRLANALDLRAEEAALYIALAEIATHDGDAGGAVTFAGHARGRAKTAWYAGDVERTRAFADLMLARAAFLRDETALARDLSARVAKSPETPSAQRALALAECAVYTLLSEPRAAAAAITDARTAVTAALPADAADAVAISVADDVIAFLDAANGTAHVRDLPHCAAFTGLLDARRGLATLELAGLAVANARNRTGSATGFEPVFELLLRDGPRFDVLLVRAYAARFVKAPEPAHAAVPTFDLTPREFDILTLLVDGLTNKEIAQRLVLSPRTVETHVERVLGKLDVGSRSRAIAKSIRLGIVSLDAPSA